MPIARDFRKNYRHHSADKLFSVVAGYLMLAKYCIKPQIMARAHAEASAHELLLAACDCVYISRRHFIIDYCWHLNIDDLSFSHQFEAGDISK